MQCVKRMVSPGVHTFARHIREQRQEIITAWSHDVEALPSAVGLSTSLLRNDVGEMLDALADALDGAAPATSPLRRLAIKHTEARYREGYDVREVVYEYHALRRILFVGYYGSHALAKGAAVPLFAVGRAIDDAVADAVDAYVRQRDHARDAFIGMLGHDLRLPLQSTMISASLLLEEPGGPPARIAGVAARIVRSVARMSELISDILDFARGRLGGGIPIVRKPTDLRPVVVRIIDEIAALHPDRDIRCLAAEAPGDLIGEWDEARVEQVVANLADNAIKHGRDPVIVEPVDLGDTVRLEVRNHGTIPDDLLAHLFDAFTPACESARHGRLGLGLYIVREIARAHGGWVSATSTDDLTTVSVVLPKHELRARLPSRA